MNSTLGTGKVNWWSIFSHFLRLCNLLAAFGSSKLQCQTLHVETETRCIHLGTWCLYCLCSNITSLEFFLGSAIYFFFASQTTSMIMRVSSECQGISSKPSASAILRVFYMRFWNGHVEQQRRFLVVFQNSDF